MNLFTSTYPIPFMDETEAVRATIRLLEDHQGRGTELISLYVPKNKDLRSVATRISNEYAQAEQIRSKRTRKNVQSALS